MKMQCHQERHSNNRRDRLGRIGAQFEAGVACSGLGYRNRTVNDTAFKPARMIRARDRPRIGDLC